NSIIGSAFSKIDTPIVNYSPFALDINYNAPGIPDSAYLGFSVGDNIAHGHSVAYIDNLSFDGFRITGINDPQLIHELHSILLFPNPSTNDLYARFYASRGEIEYTLFDLNGRVLIFSNEYAW